MMPPRTADLAETIEAAKDRHYAELEADELAIRQLGQLGWVLVRADELAQLKAIAAYHAARGADGHHD